MLYSLFSVKGVFGRGGDPLPSIKDMEESVASGQFVAAAFQALVRAVSSSRHPIALFLSDLQGAGED